MNNAYLFPIGATVGMVVAVFIFTWWAVSEGFVDDWKLFLTGRTTQKPDDSLSMKSRIDSDYDQAESDVLRQWRENAR